MHTSVLNFLNRVATEPCIRGKRVLEVGAFNVNGSPRSVIEPFGPATYVGVDIAEQERFVDVVLDALQLSEHFGPAAFDVVICTEVLEHVADWEKVTKGLDEVLAPGGLLVVTTRSPGFPLHGYPSDHWRYLPEDLGAMYPNYRTLYLGDDPDPNSPGVFFAGIKLPEPTPLKATPSPVEIPYHCEIAHNERRRTRLANRVVPNPLKTFYHVACMGPWKRVFDDQVAFLHECGLAPECHVIGTPEDFSYVQTKAPGAKYCGEDILHYETPTLQAAYEWACRNPDGAVLYLHTKGVSQPDAVSKQAWRIIMEEGLIRDWRTNLNHLSVEDMVGVNWSPAPDFPHYSGNFWMARCDWLTSLKSPVGYRNQGGPWIAGNPWERMHAETWLGSQPWHMMKSLRFQGECLWIGDRVFELLDEVGAKRFSDFVRSASPTKGFSASA